MQARDILADVSEILSTAGVDLRNRAKLVENLKYMYHVIKASSDLCALAAEKGWGKLATYYDDHAHEEAGHDAWLRADLEESGEKVGICPSSAAQLAGSMFYHLNFTHNVSLLGYMLVLEGMAPPIPVIEELEKLHGPVLLRTVRFHAEHDVDHGKKIFQMIDELPEEQIDIVHRIAIETAAQLANQFIAIQGVQ